MIIKKINIIKITKKITDYFKLNNFPVGNQDRLIIMRLIKEELKQQNKNLSVKNTLKDEYKKRNLKK